MLTCKRCGAAWFQRSSDLPQRCPKCKSARWNGPSRRDCPYCQACPDHGHPPIAAALEDTPTVTMIRVPGVAEPVPSRRPAKDAPVKPVEELVLSDEELRRKSGLSDAEYLLLSDADKRLLTILHGRTPTADQEPIPSRRPAKDAKRREFTDIELAEIIHHEFTPPIDRQMTTADQERMQIMQAMYAHDDVPRRPGLSDEEVDRIFGSETGK